MMLAIQDAEVVIAGFFVGAIVCLTWIVLRHWRKVRVAGYNARLKQMMIERGMSAVEIERVLAADGHLERRSLDDLKG